LGCDSIEADKTKLENCKNDLNQKGFEDLLKNTKNSQSLKINANSVKGNFKIEKSLSIESDCKNLKLIASA